MDELHSILSRLDRLEAALGLAGGQPADPARIKIFIKRGSTDFNNGVSANPHPPGSAEADWWAFGYDYARELDAQA